MTSVVTAVVCVVLLNIAAATLILLRSRVYGVRLYRPMLLNVVLSFLPVLLAIVGVSGLMLLVPAIQLAGASAPVLLWMSKPSGKTRFPTVMVPVPSLRPTPRSPGSDAKLFSVDCVTQKVPGVQTATAEPDEPDGQNV